MVLSERFGAREESYIRLNSRQAQSRQRVLDNLLNARWKYEAVDCFCRPQEPADLRIALSDRYGLPLRTVLCEHCGLLRSASRLDAQSTAAFYRDEYRTLYQAQSHERLFEEQKKTGASLFELLEPLANKAESVFELGCGAGGILFPFQQAGKRVCGADYGPAALEIGRKAGLDLIEGNAHELRMQRGQADIVIVWHVVEHFVDLEQDLLDLSELVKDGGILVVGVPGVESIATGYNSDLMCYLQNAHNYHFCEQTLRFALTRCGFYVEYCDESALALAIKPPANLREQLRAQPPPASVAAQVLARLTEFEGRFARVAS